MTAHPLTTDGAVELAHVERSGFTESRHLGAAVVVDLDGSVLLSRGDASSVIYPRSALKPLQATAMLSTGVDLHGPALGLATASHSGTAAHVDVVERMLALAHLADDALGCPASWPDDTAARTAAEHPRRITMTCSGKHAGFLAASMHAGWSTGDYLERGHPLQQVVARTVEEHAHESITHWGVDGCLAPTPALSLAAFARAFGSAVAGSPALLDAVRADPWTIDGPGNTDTVLIERTGFFVKTGAEGVIGIAVPGRATVVVKVLDGAKRPAAAVALALLEQVGLLDNAAELTALVTDPGVRLS